MPSLQQQYEQAREMVRWYKGELLRNMEAEEWDMAAWSARDLETWLRNLNRVLNLMADHNCIPSEPSSAVL